MTCPRCIGDQTFKEYWTRTGEWHPCLFCKGSGMLTGADGKWYENRRKLRMWVVGGFWIVGYLLVTLLLLFVLRGSAETPTVYCPPWAIYFVSLAVSAFVVRIMQVLLVNVAIAEVLEAWRRRHPPPSGSVFERMSDDYL